MGNILLLLVWPCLAAICLFGLVCIAWRRRLRNVAVAALAFSTVPLREMAYAPADGSALTLPR